MQCWSKCTEYQRAHSLPLKESPAEVQNQDIPGGIFWQQMHDLPRIYFQNQSVNPEFYETVLRCLLLRIRRICPQMHKSEKSGLHDKERSNVIRVRIFLVQYRVIVSSHPSYSPDLVPADVFLSQEHTFSRYTRQPTKCDICASVDPERRSLRWLIPAILSMIS